MSDFPDPTANLTLTVDHLPALSVDPPGVLVLTQHWDVGDTWLTVKRADPEVQFTDELLTEFANGGDNDGMYPGVRLDWRADDHNCEHCDPVVPICFTNCILHIDGRDRRVVYRICEYVTEINTWIARWPD